jgi:hypothetical protein
MAARFSPLAFSHKTTFFATLASALCACTGTVLALDDTKPADAPAVVVNPVTSPKVDTTPKTFGPITLDHVNHDWGRINDQDLVNHSFKMTNTGTATVNITEIRSTCGCSAGKTTKRTLGPGESTDIDVEFNPKGRRGTELKTITVMTDNPQAPSIELHLKSLVQPRVMIEPQSLWFGDVPIGQSKTQDITITGRMAGFDVTTINLVDNAAAPGAPRFKAEIVGRDKVDVDGESLNRVTVRTTLLEKLPFGTYNAPMVVLTNDPTMPQTNVTLAGRVVGELDVVPERMLVRMSKGGEPFSAEAMVQHRSKKPFEIISVEADGVPPEMKLVVDVIPAIPGQYSAYRIRAAGLTMPFINQIAGGVKVKTSSSEMPELMISLMGHWVGGSQMPMMAPSTGASPTTGAGAATGTAGK